MAILNPFLENIKTLEDSFGEKPKQLKIQHKNIKDFDINIEEDFAAEAKNINENKTKNMRMPGLKPFNQPIDLAYLQNTRIYSEGSILGIPIAEQEADDSIDINFQRNHLSKILGDK